MQDILVKIKTLKDSGEFDERAMEAFDEWELEIQKAIAEESLSDHFVIQNLIEGAKMHVDRINKRLINDRSEKLPDMKRDLLFAERDHWEHIINWFSGGKLRAEAVRKQVEANMTELRTSQSIETTGE